MTTHYYASLPKKNLGYQFSLLPMVHFEKDINYQLINLKKTTYSLYLGWFFWAVCFEVDRIKQYKNN